MDSVFPEEIFISYAVCKHCNHREFIVDGQTQVCNNCGEIMFRTLTRKYNLEQQKNVTQQVKFIDKNKIKFPESIDISYACCNKNDCDYGEYVIHKEKVICQYCMNQMEVENVIKNYKLNNETFQCPICEYDILYLPPYDNDSQGSYEECPNCKFQYTYYDKKELEKYRLKYRK